MIIISFEYKARVNFCPSLKSTTRTHVFVTILIIVQLHNIKFSTEV